MFTERAHEGSIIDRFDAVVRRFPSRLAVQDTAVSLSYAELAVLVDRIAAATVAATAGRAGPVALLLPTSAALPAAMLGVLAAGRAYVSLDVDFPIERNAMAIGEAGACAVISSGDLLRISAASVPPGMPIIDVQDLPIAAPPKLGLRTRSDDLAAIYYTSGSSGPPKGVAWNHRSLLHWVRVFTETAQITSADRILLLFSASVSASYRSIYCALLNGASLHVLPPLDLGLTALVQQIRARGITIYHSVPTLMRRIAESLGAGERLETIRVVCIGGERFQWSEVAACRRSFAQDVLVYSILSSTEAGPFLHAFVDDALRTTTEHPPAGRPAPGWKVTIVGNDGGPVADGEYGEIVVTSRIIALGYWRGSDRTIRPFPSDTTDPNARVLATGDHGRRRADGLIEFIGRYDERIKLHGHRIELAEVEGALTALRQVGEAAVVVRCGENGLPLSLVAYVVLRPGIHGLLPRHVQALLAQRLPHYMVPSQVQLIGELPRLPSFKIDRRALARMDAVQAIKVLERHADPLLDKVADIFEAVIGLGRATPEDTVASLGGDSLQALNVFAELERRYGVTIPDEMINQRPSIASIASWIASQVARHNSRVAPR